MTREEWKSWAMSLKTGDIVIVKGWHSVEVATVKKVTPTGRINTDKGVFAQTEYYDCYRGYGKTRGDELVPATQELIEQAEKQKREEEEARRKSQTIRAARNIAYKLCYGEITMKYDLAVQLLELVEKHKED